MSFEGFFFSSQVDIHESSIGPDLYYLASLLQYLFTTLRSKQTRVKCCSYLYEHKSFQTRVRSLLWLFFFLQVQINGPKHVRFMFFLKLVSTLFVPVLTPTEGWPVWWELTPASALLRPWTWWTGCAKWFNVYRAKSYGNLHLPQLPIMLPDSEAQCDVSLLTLLMNYTQAVWPCSATLPHMFAGTRILSVRS